DVLLDDHGRVHLAAEGRDGPALDGFARLDGPLEDGDVRQPEVRVGRAVAVPTPRLRLRLPQRREERATGDVVGLRRATERGDLVGERRVAQAVLDRADDRKGDVE